MTKHSLLLFVPTYNEVENVERMCRELLSLGLAADLLFLDDNSPDGTGDLLDRLAREQPNVRVIHRSGKLGIGTAHLAGIVYAYENEYDQLLTLDCDFTHSPADLPRLLAAGDGCDIVVGSRYMAANSLPGWNLMRRSLTLLGHIATRWLLGLRCDASGALRLYNLRRIPPELFNLVTPSSYAFFFTSLFVLARNGFRIKEVPIVLPARTYGHSKMTFGEAFRSARFLVGLAFQGVSTPERFLLQPKAPAIRTDLHDPQAWDTYWQRKPQLGSVVYGLIASTYRRLIIKPNLNRFLQKHFAPGSMLLHAGCGSGQVDADLHQHLRITAADISPEALQLYARYNPQAHRIEHASIFDLPYEEASFDGVYNLGVVEHFSHESIRLMLREFHRVLKPGGKVLIFWPHQRATSVAVLGFAHFVLNRLLRSETRLHPEEISLLSSKQEALQMLAHCDFRPLDYYFGPRDGFIQAVVVGQKPAAAESPDRLQAR